MPRVLPDQIDTKRLCLRWLDLADAHSIFQVYAHDFEVCRFVIWTPHTSEDAIREFIESCVEGWNAESRLPLCCRQERLQSTIGMIEARMLGATTDIGCVLAKSHWAMEPHACAGGSGRVGKCRAALSVRRGKLQATGCQHSASFAPEQRAHQTC